MFRNFKCECNHIGKIGCPESWYDAETELPFVNHQPNECKCVNNIKTYNRNGIILNLCLICNLSSDIEMLLQ